MTGLGNSKKKKPFTASRPIGPSLLSTLVLVACNDETSGVTDEVTWSGVALKGPLDDFRVFIDGNGNGIFDAGEAFGISQENGTFSLQAPIGETLQGEVTATTTDSASGRVLTGFFAAAPAGAAVISPMTTVLAQTGLSESELRQALGLSIDLLRDNPFDAAQISTAAARDAEHVSQQLANITRALTGLGEGAGLEVRPAFDIAATALNTVLVQHVAENSNSQIDLWGDATIGAIMTAYRAGLAAAGQSTTVFDALRAETDGAIDLINQRILAVGSLTSVEARAVFGLPSDLYTQIKAAATAIAQGQANPGLALDTWAGLGQQLTENGFVPATVTPVAPVPVFTVNDNLTVQSDIDATLEMTGGGVLGNLLAGQAFTLSQQGAAATGTLFARANGQSSAVSAQTFTLGTAGNDIIDASGAGTRVDYILGGDGDDAIVSGDGADLISAGDGNDTITADENDVIRGGNGTDTLRVFANFTATQVQQVNTIEVVNLEADGLTFSLGTLQFIDAIISGFAAGSSTIVGSNGNETINGGAGNDTLDGGGGDDILDGKGGNDNYASGTGNDTFLVTGGIANVIGAVDTGDIIRVSAGAAVDITTTQNFVATAGSWNSGGQASDFDITTGNNLAVTTVDMSLATVTTAATDGFRIVGSGINGNSLIGSSGDDIIVSTSIFGGTTFRGGQGADTIDVGAGVNTVVFAANSEGGAAGAGGAFSSGDTITSFLIAGASGGVDRLHFSSIANIQNVVGGQASFESVASGQATGTNTVVFINNATATSLTASADVTGAMGNFSGNAAGYAAGDVHIFVIGNTAGTETGIYAYTEADGAATAAEGDLMLLAILNTAATGFDADNLF